MAKELNKELRDKLKIVDVSVSKLGYKFLYSEGGLFIKRDDDNSYRDWIALRVRNIYFRNDSYYKLYFYAEPCRLSAGYSYMPLDTAKTIHNYWGKCIETCEKLNGMVINGSVSEMDSCIKDIIRHKKK